MAFCQQRKKDELGYIGGVGLMGFALMFYLSTPTQDREFREKKSVNFELYLALKSAESLQVYQP